MPHPHYKIEVSIKSIIFTILVLLGLYFTFLIKDILLFIFIGALVMAALNPLVSKLETLKISRGLSIGIVYLMLITLIITFIAIIIPPLVTQVISLFNQIPIPPDIANMFLANSYSLQDLQVIANQLTSLPKVLNVVTSTFSGIIVFVSLLVMSFYMLIERAKLHHHLKAMYKNEAKVNKAMRFITHVESEIGAWVRAEFTLMFLVGLMTFIGLSLLNVKYALALAIIAGLLEILPNLGPTLSAVPAIAVAFITGSPLLALAVLVLYIVVQQVENNFMVPMVMKQNIGLSPVITIILLLVGFRLAGVAGAALGIPLFLVGKVVVIKLYELKDQIE